MATNIRSKSRREKPPGDLRGAIQDLMSIEDEEAASRRLVERLSSLSSNNVEVVEIGQTPLCLEAEGARCRFRVHPQGMEIDRETGLLYITAVEIVEERDHTRGYWGAGRAHLFECNIEGKTIRSINLRSENEDEYHPSGMVLIAGTMFIALAQYAPETSATIIKFNVKTWTYEKLFSIQDHVGLVVPNLDEGELLLGTWGSRHYYCTDLKGRIKNKRLTPSSDTMEHQDAQLISGRKTTLDNIKLDPGKSEEIDPHGGTLMLATGVTAAGMEHFGLEIVDVASWRLKASLRWPSKQHLTKGGWPPFANPTFLWVDPYDRILALATPDDQQTGKDTTLVLYTLRQRG